MPSRRPVLARDILPEDQRSLLAFLRTKLSGDDLAQAEQILNDPTGMNDAPAMDDGDELEALCDKMKAEGATYALISRVVQLLKPTAMAADVPPPTPGTPIPPSERYKFPPDQTMYPFASDKQAQDAAIAAAKGFAERYPDAARLKSYPVARPRPAAPPISAAEARAAAEGFSSRYGDLRPAGWR